MAKRKKKNRIAADVSPSLPPVQPGLLSPTRRVPAVIARPPYAVTGDPGPSISSLTRTPDELAAALERWRAEQTPGTWRRCHLWRPAPAAGALDLEHHNPM